MSQSPPVQGELFMVCEKGHERACHGCDGWIRVGDWALRHPLTGHVTCGHEHCNEETDLVGEIPEV